MEESYHNKMMPNLTFDLDRDNVKLQADKEGLKISVSGLYDVEKSAEGYALKSVQQRMLGLC